MQASYPQGCASPDPKNGSVLHTNKGSEVAQSSYLVSPNGDDLVTRVTIISTRSFAGASQVRHCVFAPVLQ